jgi:hypothetical protein
VIVRAPVLSRAYVETDGASNGTPSNETPAHGADAAPPGVTALLTNAPVRCDNAER